ncbi:MAG TPA: chemotaxis protein CheX [Gemmatimonadales bacterium]|nr:chemotaxis protein CheX [Gemmatimonadales bacterium]
MMQYLEEEIITVTTIVWESVLGIVLEPQADVPVVEHPVVGCVLVSGAFNGAVTIECGEASARDAAATMFGVAPRLAGAAEIRDAIGELVNMTGGNVKALLPAVSKLALPTVDEFSGAAVLPGTEVVTQVGFRSEGRPLVVRLLRFRNGQGGAA